MFHTTLTINNYYFYKDINRLGSIKENKRKDCNRLGDVWRESVGSNDSGNRSNLKKETVGSSEMLVPFSKPHGASSCGVWSCYRRAKFNFHIKTRCVSVGN